MSDEWKDHRHRWRDWAIAGGLLAGASFAILTRWWVPGLPGGPGLIWQDYFAFSLAALAIISTVVAVRIWIQS